MYDIFALTNEGKIVVKDVTKLKSEDPLEMSILKWAFITQCIADGYDVINDMGIATCACCQHYFARACMKCPIALHTGHKFCVGTPYSSVRPHENDEPMYLEDAYAEYLYLVKLQRKLSDVGKIVS
jgi:hypothetical protein